MRAKEFLRVLSKLIDSIPAKTAPPVTVNVVNKISPDNKSSPEIKTALDKDVFVPPLQTKIELMKKSVGQQDKNAAMFGSEDDGPFE